MKYRIERGIPIPAGSITYTGVPYPCTLRRVGERLSDGSVIIAVTRKRRFVEYTTIERVARFANKRSNVLTFRKATDRL